MLQCAKHKGLQKFYIKIDRILIKLQIRLKCILFVDHSTLIDKSFCHCKNLLHKKVVTTVLKSSKTNKITFESRKV